MNERLEQKLIPIVNNPQVWEVIQEYLQEQIQWTHQALAVEQSELVIRQLQGKLTLLATMTNLKETLKARVEDRKNEHGN